MFTIVVLALSNRLRDLLAPELRWIAPVEFRERVADLRALVEEGEPGAVIVTSVMDAGGTMINDAIEWMRHRDPFLPIFLYAPVPDPAARDAALARALRIRFVAGDPDRLRLAVVAELIHVPRLRALRDAVRPLERLLPRELRPVLRHAVRCAVHGTRTPVAEIASALRLSPRTLHGRLRRVGWPAPREIVAWLRRVLAAQVLARPGTKVERAAAELRYRSRHGLAKLVRRRLGLNPGALRHERSAAEVLRQFEQVLREGGAAEHADPEPGS